MIKTVHIIISGKVQGVFFRATAKEVAEQFLLNGWVKNTDKGNVEVMLTGNKKSIEKFICWCRTGPEKALVSDVVVHEKPFMDFKNFTIER